jgi:hypothetical protein
MHEILMPTGTGLDFVRDQAHTVSLQPLDRRAQIGTLMQTCAVLAALGNEPGNRKFSDVARVIPCGSLPPGSSPPHLLVLDGLSGETPSPSFSYMVLAAASDFTAIPR